MNKIIVIIMVLLIFASSLQTVTSDETKLKNNEIKEDIFDKIIEKLMDLGHFPSVSACIIKGDEVVWSNSYGYSDICDVKYANIDTSYHIQSVTKTITGTALMQLYEEDLFDLDEDVNNYLPFSLRNPRYPETPITFRMLLSHSSSINNIHIMYPYDDFLNLYPMPWLEEFFIPNGEYYSSDHWTDSKPGEMCSYANLNYDMIGYLVEVISGQDFVEYCEENIFDPLDMDDTSFYYQDVKDNLAIPYIWQSSTNSYEFNSTYHPEFVTPGFYSPCGWGGMYTSVEDLSHFMIAHMNEGVYNDVRILDKDTVDEMHRIQPNSPQYLGFGLAWVHTSRNYKLGQSAIPCFNKIYSGHSGDYGDGHTRMYMKETNDIAVIYSANYGRLLTEESWNAAELLYDVLFLKAQQY